MFESTNSAGREETIASHRRAVERVITDARAAIGGQRGGQRIEAFGETPLALQVVIQRHTLGSESKRSFRVSATSSRR